MVAEVILPDNATVAWRLPGAVGHQSGANSAKGRKSSGLRCLPFTDQSIVSKDVKI